VGDGYGSEADVVLAAAGQGECPGAPSAGWSGVVVASGEGEGAVAGAGRLGFAAFSFRGSGAAVADGVSLGAGDGDAPGAVRAAGGRCGQVAAQGRVQGPETVGLAGPVGEPEQVGERDGEVGRGGQRRACAAGLTCGRAAGAALAEAAVRAIAAGLFAACAGVA